MKSQKICIQTNVAVVDNSATTCNGEFKSTDCIIHEVAISYLGLQENSSTTEIITALVSSLIDTRNRLTLAENNINNLQNPE